jgi:hypothetical protein
MATMASHVAARLVQDTQIVSYTGSRVYAHDIRLDGPDAHPEIVGPYGFLQPHIVVDDAGGGAAPFGPSAAYQDIIHVWIFAESGTTGRTAIEALTARVLVRLHRWQEANTKALLMFATRTGYVADPSPATGAQERLTFSVAGVIAGVST